MAGYLGTKSVVLSTDAAEVGGDANIAGTVTAASFVGDGSALTGLASYTAGAGLDLTGTTFSVESDLRGDVTQIGVDTNDYYLIGTTTHKWFLDGNEDMRLENDGDLHVDGNVTAYSTTVSDERLKGNIEVIDGALDKVCALSGYTFTYKHDGKASAGVIAQEVEKVLPSAVVDKELVFQGEEGESYKIVQYDQITGLLIEAIKELKAELADLKGQ